MAQPIRMERRRSTSRCWSSAPGLTPGESASRAGSIINAEVMGWQDQVGSIDKGKYADLIAVSGDPLGDITELATGASS